MVCRLGQLMRYEDPRFSFVDPVDQVHFDRITRLFQECNLLILFKDTGQIELAKIVRGVLSHLLTILRRVYNESAMWFCPLQDHMEDVSGWSTAFRSLHWITSSASTSKGGRCVAPGHLFPGPGWEGLLLCDHTYLRALLTEAGKNLKRWLMEKALARLPPSMKDTPNTRLKVLTFVSCIDIVMDDDYVDFSQMRDDIADLDRQFLQKWQIQSRFTLPKVYNMALWRLHEDIWTSDTERVQCLIVFSCLSLENNKLSL